GGAGVAGSGGDPGIGAGTGAGSGEHPADEGSSTGGMTATAYDWLTTVDHEKIGILYLAFGTVAALWGGMDAMMIRTELLTPAANVWTEGTYNALFTTHGTTMLFFFVTPVFFGITNYVLPLMIGADDLAFPRLNAIGFWLLPPALLMVRAGLTTEVLGKLLGLVVDPSLLTVLFAVAPPELGWTMYTPRSITTVNPGVNFFLLGLHLSGISTSMAAINFVVTVFTERSDDVGLGSLNVFSWTMLTTSGLVLFAFPLLGSVIVMLLLDRNFGTAFFTANGGGPMLYQHLFWFFGHPEVYIIFLPATGLVSTILPKFSDRKLFGFRFIVYSTLAMGVLSFGVWAHHMFTTGADPAILMSFMVVSIAIAVPSAIKTFNWITTMWRGSIRLTAPMLLCIGGISLFVLGGITGVFLAAIPIDVMYQDTYYVVGHFHLILMGIIPFMQFAASYYWFPLITKRMYDRRLAKLQAVLLVTGSTVTFLALVLLGMMGLPRRYAAYPAEFAPLQVVASVGAFVIGASVFLWLYVMAKGYLAGDPVRDADVWDLKRTHQFTREWQAFEEELAEEEGVASRPPDEFSPSSERQTAGETTTPPDSPRDPLAGERFAEEFTTLVEEFGLGRGRYDLTVEAERATVEYETDPAHRTETRSTFRNAYTALVSEYDVRRNLEGRVTKAEVDSPRWYRWTVERAAAEAFVNDAITEEEYVTRIDETIAVRD
ncbi:cbb3-type cytochrome c oxidase subunit I, partial [Halobium palmae]